jgi:hypothetical protein
MSLTVRKTESGLYEAAATPPHVRKNWSTVEPVPVGQLVEELQKVGCHQRDIGDALYAQDANWLEKIE